MTLILAETRIIIDGLTIHLTEKLKIDDLVDAMSCVSLGGIHVFGEENIAAEEVEKEEKVEEEG